MNKLVAVKEIMIKNIKLDEVAFIGDDLLDLPVLSDAVWQYAVDAVSKLKGS